MTVSDPLPLELVDGESEVHVGVGGGVGFDTRITAGSVLLFGLVSRGLETVAIFLRYDPSATAHTSACTVIVLKELPGDTTAFVVQENPLFPFQTVLAAVAHVHPGPLGIP